jgi:Family of unknown function (DUF6152)
MMEIRDRMAVLLLAVTASWRVDAHHSFAAEFDPNQPVLLRGVVTKVEFINPHSWIHIAVSKDDGSIENWEIEGGTPNTLFRKGINDETLPPGVEVIVDGYRSRDGANRASGRDITFADGRKLFLGGSAPPAE